MIVNNCVDVVDLQVLSSGKVIEFDTPFNLLQKQQSAFHSMVKRTGPVESKKLRYIAKEMEKLKFGTRLQYYVISDTINDKIDNMITAYLIIKYH